MSQGAALNRGVSPKCSRWNPSLGSARLERQSVRASRCLSAL